MAPKSPNCPICRQVLRAGEQVCANRICADPQRAFEEAAVVGVKEGILDRGILRLKEGAYGWAMIFARIVLGHLYAHPDLVAKVDAIIPMPAYREPHQSRKGFDHTGYVIERARLEDDRGLPFVLDPPLIRKTRPTARMRETSSLVERRVVAQALYDALEVPAPERVKGRSIMVYDDVLTGGNTLNAVAMRLKASGAAKVYGLVLARAQWRP